MPAIHHATVKSAASHGLTIAEEGAHGLFAVRTASAGTLISSASVAKDALALALLAIKERMEEEDCDEEGAIGLIDGDAADAGPSEDDHAEGDESPADASSDPEATDAPADAEDGSDEPSDEASVDADDEPTSDAAAEGRSVVKRKYKKAYKPHKMTCGDLLSSQVSDHVKIPAKVDGKSVKRIDEAKLRRFAEANGVWNPAYSVLNVGMRRMNIANRLRKLVKDDPDFTIAWVD